MNSKVCVVRCSEQKLFPDWVLILLRKLSFWSKQVQGFLRKHRKFVRTQRMRLTNFSFVFCLKPETVSFRWISKMHSWQPRQKTFAINPNKFPSKIDLFDCGPNTFESFFCDRIFKSIYQDFDAKKTIIFHTNVWRKV